ncbi:MAG: dephospho-CoA kinase [Myxococcota bacterium]|nr:dephospho-CoA kinase [Myxococcota bacterium]
MSPAPLSPGTVVGLTGSISSGKSTVARYFEHLGATRIDADQLAREVVAPGAPALQEIVERWGEVLLDERGALRRAALAERIFSSPAERRALELITHPAIAQLSATRIADAKTKGARLIIYEAALLVETGRAAAFRPLIVVTAPRQRQLEWLVARDGLSMVAAQARIDSQLDPKEKARAADYLIDNSGDIRSLEAECERLWSTLVGATTR